MNITHERVRQQIVNILHAWGMADDLVQITADAMVETDLLGVDSHGISMLMSYESRKREGKLNLAARPTILRETPAWPVWACATRITSAQPGCMRASPPSAA